MPQQVTTSVENNFTRGLITESTGLNFPENAATDADNCVFSLIGDVTRRLGFDYEDNFSSFALVAPTSVKSSYKWNNVGGDGQTQIVVEQIGNFLFFYRSSSATIDAPLSTTKLASSVNLSNFITPGNLNNPTITECQYADGNGYLFVFHPDLDSFYCAYDTNTFAITVNKITLKIRDFSGMKENTAVNYRPLNNTPEHLYNLLNQGWSSGATWTTTSSTITAVGTGSRVFTTAASLSVVTGDNVTISTNIDLNVPTTAGNLAFIPAGSVLMTGSVTAYAGTSLTVNVYSIAPIMLDPGANLYVSTLYGTNVGVLAGGVWVIQPTNTGFISQWATAVSNNPSNADVWWYFKDSTGAFNPAVMYTRVSLNSGPAPKGHFIIDAFDQQRSLIGSVAGLTPITTIKRPSNGAWFQGRVWYTGVTASQTPTGDASYYTWTENIYFSQIVTDTNQFGSCYQTNDPTSQNFFDLLPTDGGVVQIQGCGTIYKLFPIQNGMLVHAANGIWFITGSQGIGFSANDYTVTKISSIQSISSTSFVNVQGLPYFWNEEGIYTVKPTQGGALTVEPITVGTILSFYNEIPLSSKKFARGDYDPINYNIQWVFRSTEATVNIQSYQYDRILNYNTYNKAFYPYTIATTNSSAHSAPLVCGIIYVSGPGGSTSPEPTFKYYTSDETSSTFTFSEEKNENYLDWFTADNIGIDYSSFFVTGYKLRGQAIKKFQPQYIQVYYKTNGAASACKLQGYWDYSNHRSSGKWGSVQFIVNGLTRFATVFRRHRIRGRGFALQLKFSSVTSTPFDIQGWAIEDTVNQGI